MSAVMSGKIFLLMQSLIGHAHLLLLAWAIFFLAALINLGWRVVSAGERLTAVSLFNQVFPRQMWTTANGYFDILMYFVAKLIKPVISLGEVAVTLVIGAAVSQLLRATFHVAPVSDIGTGGIVIVTLVAWIFWDFSNFFAHYLLHRVPFLWELHKVHHSATFLSPFTAARLHPIEEKFGHMTAALFTGAGFGLVGTLYAVSVEQFLLSLAFANLLMSILFMDALRHSHIPVSFGSFERVFVSPRMHHLHHSAKLEHWDMNLGYVLSLWDHLFGTYHLVTDGEKFDFGIGRGASVDASYNSVYGGYVRPTIASFLMLVGVRQPEPRPIPKTRLVETTDIGITT
jgi:sterol desaturase/sphingolipid hydroxylase (fatty acid hydroxylase superfamily)